MTDHAGTFDCPVCTDGGPHPHTKDKWIGVDFDGTLAKSIERITPYELGEPVPAMVQRVRSWIAQGFTVKLFTARMNEYSRSTNQPRDLIYMESELRRWCREHIGQELECVNEKDGLMEVLWDDRAVRVVRDLGVPQEASGFHKWIEEELSDGDRLCEALGVSRTEGGRLQVRALLNAVRDRRHGLTSNCWCRPAQDAMDPTVWVHNKDA